MNAILLQRNYRTHGSGKPPSERDQHRLIIFIAIFVYHHKDLLEFRKKHKNDNPPIKCGFCNAMFGGSNGSGTLPPNFIAYKLKCPDKVAQKENFSYRHIAAQRTIGQTSTIRHDTTWQGSS
jgi:hypothetical protein